ncbi:MAG: glycosyltransferase [Actinomycetota bacterium]
MCNRPGMIAAMSLNPLLPFPSAMDQQTLCHPELVWNTKSAFEAARRRGPLAYHVMSPFELGVTSQSVVPPHAIKSDVPLVVTLYDLIPLRFPARYLANRDYAQRYRTRLELLRQADAVLAISEHTRRDALELLDLDPARVKVVGAGVSSYFHPTTESEEPLEILNERLPAVTKAYVLAVSGMEWRKNTPMLIEAYSQLPKDVRRDLQLVIACSLNDDYRSNWLARAKHCGLKPDELVLTGQVSDSTLRALYQGACLSVLPSLYEGFGFPAAEAAACGCPVLVSNVSAMPEVLNFDQATFNPADPAELSNLIHRSITEREFRDDLLSAAGTKGTSHRWEAVAARTAEALQVLPQPREFGISGLSGLPRRPSIALVGPFPPIRSGIADYNWRIAGELSRLCDLDIITVGKFDRGLASTLRDARYFSIGALGRILNPMSYDAIIYSFGNNQHHHRTYDAALSYPGIIWLHDIRIPLFYLSYAMSHLPIEQWGTFMTGKVSELYGPRAPDHIVRRLSYLPQEYVDFAVGMTGEIVKSCRGVIVNSEVAQRLLKLDLGPEARFPPLSVIPLAAPRPFGSLPDPETPPIIVCLGFVAEVKAPDLVMDALALLRRSIPARLAFVGPLREDLAPALRDYAYRRGIGEAVDFVDDVPADQYREWLGRASCSVHVRYSTNGESSSAVNDCLAAGLPVITNIPACRQIPSEAIDYLDSDVSASELAARIGRLLEDPQRRAAQAAAGKLYAEQTNFALTAERVVSFVETLLEP